MTLSKLALAEAKKYADMALNKESSGPAETENALQQMRKWLTDTECDELRLGDMKAYLKDCDLTALGKNANDRNYTVAQFERVYRAVCWNAAINTYKGMASGHYNGSEKALKISGDFVRECVARSGKTLDKLNADRTRTPEEILAEIENILVNGKSKREPALEPKSQREAPKRSVDGKRSFTNRVFPLRDADSTTIAMDEDCDTGRRIRVRRRVISR